MRVFLDTHVLVSAFTTRGLCDELVRTVFFEHEPVVSAQVLAELERVLRDRFGAPETAVRAALDLVRDQAEVVAAGGEPSSEPRDPDDRAILAAAEAAAVDALVTGDRDLLALAAPATVPILDPRGFWRQLCRATVPPRRDELHEPATAELVTPAPRGPRRRR